MKKLKQEDGKKIWLKVLKENFQVLWSGVDLSPVLEKLKLLKFTYNGAMKTTISGNEYRLERNYAYVSRHYPSLITIWNRKMLELETGEKINLSKEKINGI